MTNNLQGSPGERGQKGDPGQQGAQVNKTVFAVFIYSSLILGDSGMFFLRRNKCFGETVSRV